MPGLVATPGRRPRPVAGLPAVHPVAVAKAWLLELIAVAPLEAAVVVPVDDLARDAPPLCAAIVAALGDDAALARLEGGDLASLAGRVGALSGATSAAEVILHVEALRVVLHRALRRDEDPALEADLAARLGHVCAQLAAAGVVGAAGTRGTAFVAAPAVAPPAAASGPGAAPASPGSVLGVGRSHPAGAPSAGPAGPVGAPRAALGAALAASGGVAAVLAVEVDDRGRLTAVEGEAALAAALAPVDAALAALASAGDVVTEREAAGRWWVIAAGRGGGGAQALAQQVVGVIAAAAPARHGVPLTASVGVAAAPDNGTDVETLLEHADQGVFTARALGVPIA